MIEHIDIINLSHYDIGFTDHPSVCRALQRRYLDRALELASANRRKSLRARFYWTCESGDVVLGWWQQASRQRRHSFLQAVRAGWIEVCAMPFNHGPTMDARQWNCCARWLPAKLWQAFRPRTILQNDVNGMPRAGVMALMDRGAEFLWMALNGDTGGTPAPQPSAFWWAMPDGRKIFVWNSITYPDGYYLFADEWRRGPLPTAGDARYRPPRAGDILVPSRKNLAAARERCCARLESWAKRGYAGRRVAVSMTNMWRVDNDPPCEQLPEFIAAWNARGYKPALAFTTPARALTALRSLAGPGTPVLTGEWPDWWANGVASTPRALSASRRAKRLLAALDSPRYSSSRAGVKVMDQCLRELCLFDEHTWGAWNSAARPDTLESRGHFAEKASLAYRPLAAAELALGDRNRALVPGTRGIHVVNPYALPFTGWVELPEDCLRGRYAGVREAGSGAEQAFDKIAGVSAFYTKPERASQFTPLDAAKVFPDNIRGKILRLWVENLRPHGVRSYRLVEEARPRLGGPGPGIETERAGWPVKICWPAGQAFTAPLGDFFSLEFQGFAPRWKYKEILALPGVAQRRAARAKWSLLRQASQGGRAVARDAGPTLVYTQYLSHPRLRRMKRTLEVFKAVPRVRLRVAIDRLSKPEAAEIFYLRLPLNCPGGEVRVSQAGLAFRPGAEQIPNSCKDYFAIDGEVTCARGAARAVLACHDNALVAFGGMHDGLMLPELGRDLDDVYAILFNNIWYTNFMGDEAGVMEYSFDLWRGAAPAGFAPEAFAVVQV